MPTIITVSPRAVIAVASAVAKNDVRGYLNGVHFAPLKGAAVRVAGCDGYRIHVARDRDAGHTALPAEGIVVPLEPLLKLAKMDARPVHDYRYATFIVIETDHFETALGEATVSRLGASFKVNLIEGRYPDIAAIMAPAAHPDAGVAATFNPDYIADALKAAKDLARSREIPMKYPTATILPDTADRSWSVMSDPNDSVTLTCVVMPARHGFVGPPRGIARSVLE